MRSSLFVGSEDVADFWVIVESVIDIKYCAAGIAEYCVNALFEEALHENF